MAPPQLRGFLRRQLYRDIVTAITLGWVAGAGWWFGVAIPRRKQYEDFYRNYDANAVAESMKASFEEGRWALFRMTPYNQLEMYTAPGNVGVILIGSLIIRGTIFVSVCFLC